MTTGWLCPKCGSGVAPGVERCPCVPQQFTHPAPGSVYPTTWPTYPTTPVPYPTMQPKYTIPHGDTGWGLAAAAWQADASDYRGSSKTEQELRDMTPGQRFAEVFRNDTHKDDAKVPGFKG